MAALCRLRNCLTSDRVAERQCLKQFRQQRLLVEGLEALERPIASLRQQKSQARDDTDLSDAYAMRPDLSSIHGLRSTYRRCVVVVGVAELIFRLRLAVMIYT